MQQVGPEPAKATIPPTVRRGRTKEKRYLNTCAANFGDSDEYAFVASAKRILDKMKPTAPSMSPEDNALFQYLLEIAKDF